MSRHREDNWNWLKRRPFPILTRRTLESIERKNQRQKVKRLRLAQQQGQLGLDIHVQKELA